MRIVTQYFDELLGLCFEAGGMVASTPAANFFASF